LPGTGRASAPIIVVGSLLAALGLTALGDTHAQAQRTDPRKHARLVPDHDATELRVLDWTLWNVSKYYVEPDRIDPQAMTLAALEALEQGIAEVLVEPLEDGKKVRVRVGTASKEFDIGEVEALWAVGPHVREVFRFVNKNTTLDEEEQREAEYAIVAGVLSTLDPHTNLLRPEDFEDMQASTKGSFGGLGIEVGMRDGVITVIRVIEDNPAAKVDMRPGDRIVQIDAESTATMTLNDAVDRLRGPTGTTVTVYVMRDGLQKPKPLEVTRATIQLDSVIGDVIEDTDEAGKPRKVGLVQIPRNFSQNTGQELRDKLSEFERQGVQGVVLDLRGNPGGLLNAAVDVADAFLSSGTIVATVGVASPRKESHADDRYDFPDLPLVVLVDQGSASASEIVAGALRNQGRAVLLGRRSFGKGSVQELRDRKVADKELALKLTVAQYLTPGDVSIQSVGVAPDVETIPVWVSDEHVAYFGRERFDLLREESLSDHLESDKAEALRRSPFSVHFLDQGSLDPNRPEPPKGQKRLTDDEARAEHKSKVAPPREADKDKDVDGRTAILLEDPEIRMARDLVVWAPSSNRDELLGRMDQFVDRQQGLEQQRIAGSLAARGIDWSPGPKPATGAAKLRMSVACDKAGNTIKGGEQGTVNVSVTNDGDAPAFQVRAITDSDYRYFDERELVFGRIDPGASKSFSVKLAVGENELSRTDRIDMHLFEQHGAKLAAGSQSSIDISAEGLPRPHFAFGYQVLDMPTKGTEIDGNGDGVWQVGERVVVRVHVSNKGEGPALDTWVNLRNLSDEAMFIHEGRQRIKKLDVGDTRVIDLDAELRSAPLGGQARAQLSVTDTKVGEALAERVVFPVIEGGAPIEDDRRTVITRDVVDLYASPLQPDRRVAWAPAGERFRTTGVSGEWVRVDLGDGGFAFAKRSELDEDSSKVKAPGKHEAVLEVSPPVINLVGSVTQTEASALDLTGSITDETRVQDVFITVANPSRDLFASREKVFYEASPEPGTGKLDFSASVPLTPGNNLIEVYAREGDEVIATRRMWVLRTSGLAEARAKDSEFASNGKLSVDTLQK
jgi:carboxyl-terminal processing protease